MASRVKYNLGVVKYRQALDAHADLPGRADRSPFGHRVLPRQPAAGSQICDDARYNLELAYQLLQRIDEQRVQGQRNAETRNQKTSENRGQSFPDRAQDEQSGRPDADADAQEEMQGQQAAETPPKGAPSRAQSQARQAASPQPMTPEAAQEMLETLREKSEVGAEPAPGAATRPHARGGRGQDLVIIRPMTRGRPRSVALARVCLAVCWTAIAADGGWASGCR